jgi:hypothetical protein
MNRYENYKKWKKNAKLVKAEIENLREEDFKKNKYTIMILNNLLKLIIVHCENLLAGN